MSFTESIIQWVVLTLLLLVVFVCIILNYPTATVNDICNDFGLQCETVYVDGEKPNVFVHKDIPTFYVVGGIEKKLTKDQLNIILLHELGHIVLKHHERLNREVAITSTYHNKRLSNEQFCSLSRNFEYEADIFATYVARKYNMPTVLDDTFEQLFGNTEHFNRESCTHPTFSQRIEYIRRFENYLEG